MSFKDNCVIIFEGYTIIKFNIFELFSEVVV